MAVIDPTKPSQNWTDYTDQPDISYVDWAAQNGRTTGIERPRTPTYQQSPYGPNPNARPTTAQQQQAPTGTQGGSNPTQRQPGASPQQRTAAMTNYIFANSGNTGARGGGVSSLSPQATAARNNAAQWISLPADIRQQMADQGLAPTINGVYGGGYINDRSAGAPEQLPPGVFRATTPMAGGVQAGQLYTMDKPGKASSARPYLGATQATGTGPSGGGGMAPLPQQGGQSYIGGSPGYYAPGGPGTGGTRLANPGMIGQQLGGSSQIWAGPNGGDGSNNPFAGAPNPKAAALRPSVGPTQGMGGAGGGGMPGGGGGAMTGFMSQPGYTTPSVANANPFDEASMIAAQEADRNAALQQMFGAQQAMGGSALAQNIEGLGAQIAGQGDIYDERTQRDMEARIIDENRTAQADAARAMYEDMGGTGRLGGGAAIGGLRDTRRRYDQDRANQLRDFRMGVAGQNAEGRRANLGAATGAFGAISQPMLGMSNKIADIFANTDRSEQDYAKMLYQQYLGMGGGYGA